MFLVTTSRRPSRRTRSFLKDLVSILPDSRRLNRGKLSLRGLLAEAVVHNCKRIVIVNTFKGNPGSIDFYEVKISSLEDISSNELRFMGRIILKGVSLSNELNYSRCVGKRILKIDDSECSSKLCLEARELLVEALVKASSNHEKQSQSEGIVLIIRDRGDYIELSFKTDSDKICGPVIRIRKIVR